MEGHILMEQGLKEKTVHGSEDYPFAVYCIFNPKHPFVTPSHWHEEIEIIRIKSGTLHVNIGDETYEGHKDDVYIVNSKEIHGMSLDDLDTKYVTLLFPLSSLAFLNIDNVSKEYLMPLQEQKKGFITDVTDTPVSDSLREDIDRIVSLNHEKSEAYQLGTKALLMDIIYLLCSASLTVKNTQKPDDGLLNRNILSYIRENFTEDISLSSVASQFYMSEKYFSRYFKHTFKVTFVEYVNRLRIELAAKLLTESDLSVTEIALRCGYSGSSYFNKVFKSHMGVTPSQYRR